MGTCGCTIAHDGTNGERIIYCPLHAAASVLRAAVQHAGRDAQCRRDMLPVAAAAVERNMRLTDEEMARLDTYLGVAPWKNPTRTIAGLSNEAQAAERARHQAAGCTWVHRGEVYSVAWDDEAT